MKKIFKILIFVIILLALIFFITKKVYKTDYLSIINRECAKYNIDNYEILSIIKAESNFDADATSSKGAVGLMQLTPETANWCAEKLDMLDVGSVDLKNPEINIMLGVYYYNYLIEQFADFNTRLAAYNAGMGNVKKWLENADYSKDGVTIEATPYKETNLYITKINNNYKIYKILYKEL